MERALLLQELQGFSEGARIQHQQQACDRPGRRWRDGVRPGPRVRTPDREPQPSERGGALWRSRHGHRRDTQGRAVHGRAPHRACGPAVLRPARPRTFEAGRGHQTPEVPAGRRGRRHQGLRQQGGRAHRLGGAVVRRELCGQLPRQRRMRGHRRQGRYPEERGQGSGRCACARGWQDRKGRYSRCHIRVRSADGG